MGLNGLTCSADVQCMATMDPKHVASVISDSLLAALRIALELGSLTQHNLQDVARAAANNAAQQLAMEIATQDD